MSRRILQMAAIIIIVSLLAGCFALTSASPRPSVLPSPTSLEFSV